MDRKTTSVLNGVVRELFEATEVNNAYTGPLADKMEQEEQFAHNILSAAKSAKDNADLVNAAKQNEANEIIYQTARQKLIPERNPHRGPDPALGKKFDMDAGIAARAEKHGDDPALGPHLNTYSNIRARNPEDPTAYDPALGELNPWYQRLGHWVGQNPEYAALAAGAPLALAAGAYYLNKRRKGNK